MRVFRSPCQRGKIIPLWGTSFASQGKRKNEKTTKETIINTKKQREREFEKMELMPIFEVVRIKQEIRGVRNRLRHSLFVSPEDAKELAEAHISRDEDREVFLVMMLNTKNQVIGLIERMWEV